MNLGDNASSMEEELTCPVCLELYADPLLLPCSHSICKKCIQDIVDNRTKTGKEGLDCPSCRKTCALDQEMVSKLPRNLALENVVFRFQEMQSQNLTLRRSLDLSMDTPFLNSPTSPDVMEIPEFSDMDLTEMCGLCEENSQNVAENFCEQCRVAYCRQCLQNFHPKRGPLVHHRIRRPVKGETIDKPAFCVDHETEVAAIFCDQCKSLVCHLCVCDGLGKHSHHKILSLDTAWRQAKETLSKTKEQLEMMVSTLSDQSLKMEEVSDDVENMHKQACQKIDIQYRRLIEDITACLKQHRSSLLYQLERSKVKVTRRIHQQLDDNRQESKKVENLIESCKKLLDEDHMKGLLGRADEIGPIVQKVDDMSQLLETSKQQYTDLVTDKTALVDMKQSVLQFRNTSHACLRIMIVDDVKKCQSIIPVIRSTTSPGKDVPRVQNKCLITWGFNSTSFTAEALKQNSLWSVTIEKNSAHLGDIKNGYLFGAGISSDKLNFKDQVGLNTTSHGIICSGGNLLYCHNSKMEHLMPLDNLPLSVTIYTVMDQSEGVILAYTITNSSWGDTLHGKKIIMDQSFKTILYPVFTVSQRVKMQFPTYV
ncbi:hypothetical protein ACJMK2_009489 [Sinanodonta woodiana]|uniref:Uncharacterized protein n=1 Tax=Sinanodonta woodiana TaxID=1069815 RepID=A0ABD3VCG3_SINWO